MEIKFNAEAIDIIFNNIDYFEEICIEPNTLEFYNRGTTIDVYVEDSIEYCLEWNCGGLDFSGIGELDTMDNTYSVMQAVIEKILSHELLEHISAWSWRCPIGEIHIDSDTEAIVIVWLGDKDSDLLDIADKKFNKEYYNEIRELIKEKTR